MQRKTRRRWFGRLTAAAGALLLFCLPLDWSRLGSTLTLAAASIGQPQNTAALLQQRLQRPVTHVDSGDTGSYGEALPFAPTGGDHTAPDVDSLPVTAPVTVPAEDGSGGKIYERTLDPGDTHSHPVAVRNRSQTAVNVEEALQTALTPLADTAEPQVLIIHTHTTEGYMTYDAGYYNAADRQRTKEHGRNVCAVGEAVAATLRQAGVNVLHDTTVHDSPQYTGAYTRSAQTVQGYLEKYPSIRVVLDLHRDAVMEGDTGLIKPTATVNGKKAAQMMILVGVTDTAALPHPHWKQNLALAVQWQKALTDREPTLMRPLNTVASRYNQHLSPGYLLVEVGSEGNTVAEAVYSGQLLGKTLAEIL